jgi:hypothetical protein
VNFNPVEANQELLSRFSRACNQKLRALLLQNESEGGGYALLTDDDLQTSLHIVVRTKKTAKSLSRERRQIIKAVSQSLGPDTAGRILLVDRELPTEPTRVVCHELPDGTFALVRED